jgi:hypothetical protein
MKNRSQNDSPLSNRAREFAHRASSQDSLVHGLRRESGNGHSWRGAPPTDRPDRSFSSTYEPGVAVIAQGRKRVDLGRTTFIYGESRYLLTSVDLPIVSQIIEAREEAPLSRRR